ncbi:MAG: hypothetical protein V7642_1314 [Burkholderiales bacterium]|jgi:uncharacterized membrane protein YcaP (DUF421 family)
MGSFFSIDWGEVFGFSVPVFETIIRGTAVYWFLFFIFRFVVRRDVGAVGIADILILVIVADAAQNAMAGEYTSVSDGILLVSTLIGWNLLLDWLSFRSESFRRFAEPPPLKLVRNGRMLTRNMRKELITEDELWSKLRQAGVESLDQVKEACIETDGQISVIKRSG